jgi:hypothetical protein
MVAEDTRNTPPTRTICRNKLSRCKRRDYQRLQRAQHGRNTLCKPLNQRAEFVTHGYDIRYSNLIVASAIVTNGRRERDWLGAFKGYGDFR